jgi:hypothetical protein
MSFLSLVARILDLGITLYKLPHGQIVTEKAVRFPVTENERLFR